MLFEEHTTRPPRVSTLVVLAIVICLKWKAIEMRWTDTNCQNGSEFDELPAIPRDGSRKKIIFRKNREGGDPAERLLI